MGSRVAYQIFAIPPDGEKPYNYYVRHHGYGEDESNYLCAPEEAKSLNEEQAFTSYFSILKEHRHYRFELRRLLDKKWRQRERNRVGNEYMQLPYSWDNLELPEDHYTHIAQDSEGDYIAYTQSPEKGERDIQTPMRAGKYLKKFFPDMHNDEIRRYAEDVQSACGLQMTDDPELAAIIYENGPNSCMCKSSDYWYWYDRGVDGPRHPSAVYFAGDLKLAWMGPHENASARCLVWPERKLYGRMYGATDRMRAALERAGYKCSYDNIPDTFPDARLKLIRITPQYIVMPYLDAVSALHYNKETKQIHIGRSLGDKNKKQFSWSNTESGVCHFIDPDTIVCNFTGKIIPKGAPHIEISDGVYTTEEVAKLNGYVLSIEGWTSNPGYFCREDSEEIHCLNVYPMPPSYRRDVLQIERHEYRHKSECVYIRDRDGWTRKGNISKLVEYKGKYYTSLQALAMYEGIKLPFYPEKGHYSPKQWEVMLEHCNKWLSEVYDSKNYGKDMEECYEVNPSHYWALVTHFDARVRREQEYA